MLMAAGLSVEFLNFDISHITHLILGYLSAKIFPSRVF